MNLDAVGLFTDAWVDAWQPNAASEPYCDDGGGACAGGINYVKVTDGSPIDITIFDE